MSIAPYGQDEVEHQFFSSWSLRERHQLRHRDEAVAVVVHRLGATTSNAKEKLSFLSSWAEPPRKAACRVRPPPRPTCMLSLAQNSLDGFSRVRNSEIDRNCTYAAKAHVQASSLELVQRSIILQPFNVLVLLSRLITNKGALSL